MTARKPSADTAGPKTRRQCQVVVEVVETRCGHESLATHAGRPAGPALSHRRRAGVVGERWVLLIVRELALGNSRFQDIVRGTGAPRDRVAARIKTLDEAG